MARDLYAQLFAALPTPHVAVDPDMVVVDANDAYLGMFGMTRADVVGRDIVSLFPPDPGSLDVDGTPFILQSFQRAAASRRPDPMPVARYDIADRDTGVPRERYWSHLAVPVVADDEVVLVVQVLTEVTDYVLGQQAALPTPTEGTWRARAEEVEAQMLARAGEVSRARAAESDALALRAALAEAALGMAKARDLAELRGVLVDRGLRTVGATTGAIGVLRGRVVSQAITTGADDAIAAYAEIPLDSELIPAAVTVGRRPVLLGDRAVGGASGAGMAEMFEATGLHAVVGYPLLAGGETLGALTFGWDHPRSFSPADEDVFSALAAQCAQALVRIRARDAEQARAVQAVEMSEALQRSLLTEPTQHPGCTVAARYRPAGLLAQIGGDWFDSFTTAAGLVDVVVGDVSGHDQDAAALMGQARNLLRGIAYTVDEPPAAVVGQLDRAMADLGTGVYATLVLACLEEPDEREVRVVRWTNAGHPAPLVVRTDGRVELLDTRPELMLGVDPAARRSDHRAELAPGETLLLYTDGLVERRGTDLDDGTAWLVATVGAATAAGVRGGDLCDHLLDLVAQEAEDDIALLALQLDPAPVLTRDRDDLWLPAATPPVPAPAQQWALTDLRGLAAVRRAARQLLLDTALPTGAAGPEDPDVVEDTVEQVVLVIDELASNALRHGRPPARLEVFDRADSWVVVAADAAVERLPEPAVDRPAAEGGHGLYLVADLSLTHGVDVTPEDKQVWAEVPKPPTS